MKITEVRDRKQRKAFLDTARIIYRNDPNWVCPLDQDIEAVFDPKQNSFHAHGRITRWILCDDQNRLIGRVAAFIDDHKAGTPELPTGGMGFFECIDDPAAATLLFITAQNWLAERGMKAMIGPINFGENDSFWGLLSEGFTPPSFGMNYHHPYYQALFRQFGFETVYEQITNHLSADKPFPERFTKIARWVARKPGYTFEHLRASQLERFAREFREIYNDAWHDFAGFTPITLPVIRETFKKMKPILDEKLIWFAYVNGEPAAFVVVLPDANQIIKPLNGKLGWIEKLKFLYYRYKGTDRMRAVVMGTKKSFRNHGLESVLFIKLKEYVLPLNKYRELELSWVGDFNDKMLAIHEATGAVFGKKHLTLRKVF